MKKVKVGLVGCGVISNTYLTNINKFYPKLQVIACADISKEKAQQISEDYEIGKVYTVDELLNDSNIDIILNLTVPQVHYEINKKALLKGKNVYCEKPLALTFSEAQELVELANNKDVMLGCAPDSFLGSALQTCRKLIDDGWIGKPISATANMVNHGIETWHPNPDFFYKSGGGPMLDMGPYYITALVSLLGPIAKTSCFMTKGFDYRKIYSQPRRGESIVAEVPTHYSGILKFQNNVVANINMSFDVWLSNLPKLEIYGTEGVLLVPDPNQFSGNIKLVRSEDLIDEIDGLENSQAIGKLSKPEMWNKFRDIPHLYRQPDKNMRGIGLVDMAYAIENGRDNRASAKLACHVTEVLECLNTEDEKCVIKTMCERPRPIPIGLDVGQMD